MAKQVINIGATPNDRHGDPLRTAFSKINENFTELYTLTGGTAAEFKELAQDYAANMFTSGSHVGISVVYEDLNNKMNLIVANQSWSQITEKPSFANIAFSGDYADLLNVPPGTVVSVTAPVSPQEGTLWYDTNDGRLFIFYSNSWVDASPDTVYSLPTASDSVLGGVKIGANLSIDGDGVLSTSIEPQVNADWTATTGVAQILNKPTSLNSFTNDPGFIDSTYFGDINFNTNKISVSGTSTNLFLSGNTGGKVKTLGGLEVLTGGPSSTVAVSISTSGFTKINIPVITSGQTGVLLDGSPAGTGGATPQVSGTLLRVVGNNGFNNPITADSYGSGVNASFTTRGARGTSDAPEALQAGDVFGRIAAVGYGDTNYVIDTVNGANGRAPTDIRFVALETFTDTTSGSQIQFNVSPVGAATRTTVASLDATSLTTTVDAVIGGKLVINSTETSTSSSTGALTVAGGMGVEGPIWINKSVYVSTEGEGFYGDYIGNNVAGQDFVIRSNPDNDGTVHIYGDRVDIHTTANANPVFQVLSDGQVVMLTPSFDQHSGAVSIIGSSDGSFVDPNNSGIMLHVTGQPATPARFYVDGAAGYAGFIGRRYNGTSATPIYVGSNEEITRIGAIARDDSGMELVSQARMSIITSETQTSTTHGNRIEFWTTPIGSTTIGKNITIDSNGITFADATSQNTAGIPLSQKGVANGVATLGNDGKVTSAQLPAGAVTYQGVWDASTNTPFLADGAGTSGNEYSVVVGGTVDFGHGSITFNVGDFVIYSGTLWQRIPSGGGVSSFNNRTGAVTLSSSDVTSALTYTPYNGAINPNGYVNIAGAAAAAPVQSVFGRTGTVTLQTSDVTSVLSAGTITNTMLAGSITNAKLVNSSVNINGTNINLGDTVTITAAAGTLTGTTLNSSITTSSLTSVGTLGSLTVTGTASAGTLTATSNTSSSATSGAIRYGSLGYADVNILASFQSSVNGYNQVIVQNTSSGSAASANFIVSNNNGNATQFYGEFGMNSGTFTGTGAFNAPNAVYVSSQSSDLVLGTQGNHAIHFVTNNGTTDAVTISGAGVATFANTIVGNISGNSATVTNGIYTTDTGTVTNSMLAGSIANNKLLNSSVTINGSTISLGGTTTITAAAGTLTGTTLNSTVVSSSLTSVGTLTNLSVTNTITGSISGNAGTVTNGVYTTDTGSVTNTMLAGSIANNKLVNSSVTVTAGTGLTGGGTVALGGTITLTNAGVTSAVAGSGISVSGATGAVTITNTGVTSLSGTANQITASGSTGSITLSLPSSGVIMPGPLTLAAGTTVTAPLQFTAGALLTAPGAGVMNYDGTAFYATPTNGQRSLLITPQSFLLSSNRSLVNNQTQQSIFGVGATLANSTRYVYKINVSINRNGGTGSIDLDYALSSNTGFAAHGFQSVLNYLANGATTNAVSTQVSANFTTNVILTPSTNWNANTIGVLRITGYVDTAATGVPVFNPVIAFVGTNPGGTPLIMAGSLIEIYPVGSTTGNTSVGTWA